MFRFAKSGSAHFQILSWLFVASLFCDGSNLDDLFHGAGVLHDDFDIGAACAGGPDGVSPVAGRTYHVSGDVTVGTLPAPASPRAIRIVIDQDSPSLESDGLCTIFEPLGSFRDTPGEWSDSLLPSELLHIRFRNLLI
jgi:hypothetical protein